MEANKRSICDLININEKINEHSNIIYIILGLKKHLVLSQENNFKIFLSFLDKKNRMKNLDELKTGIKKKIIKTIFYQNDELIIIHIDSKILIYRLQMIYNKYKIKIIKTIKVTQSAKLKIIGFKNVDIAIVNKNEPLEILNLKNFKKSLQRIIARDIFVYKNDYVFCINEKFDLLIMNVIHSNFHCLNFFRALIMDIIKNYFTLNENSIEIFKKNKMNTKSDTRPSFKKHIFNLSFQFFYVDDICFFIFFGFNKTILKPTIFYIDTKSFLMEKSLYIKHNLSFIQINIEKNIFPLILLRKTLFSVLEISNGIIFF